MYQIDVLRINNWNTYANVSTAVNFDNVVVLANSIYLDPLVDCEDVAVIDDQTGEILWNAIADEKGIDEDDYPIEPLYVDDDCGYDPYLGCFTDDC